MTFLLIYLAVSGLMTFWLIAVLRASRMEQPVRKNEQEQEDR